MKPEKIDNYGGRKMTYICAVCNYNGLDEPPYSKEGNASYEICPCCGFQFGYDDYPNKEESQKKWYKEWVANGSQWYSKSRLPHAGWNPKNQI